MKAAKLIAPAVSTEKVTRKRSVPAESPAIRFHMTEPLDFDRKDANDGSATSRKMLSRGVFLTVEIVEPAVSVDVVADT